MQSPLRCDSPEPQGLPLGYSAGQDIPIPQDVVSPSSRIQAASTVTLPAQDPEGNRTGTVIARIENILESILDDLLRQERSVSIPYRRRPALTRSRSEASDVSRSASPSPLDRAACRGEVLRFPGKTRHEGKKFAAVLRILELSHEALVSGTIITKRNIYYQNVDLFREQRVVDGLVDDLAFTLGVSRDALNIVAAARGLVAGPIFLMMHNGSIIPCGLAHEGGTLIPPARLVHRINFGSTRWVLVIEKEATFRTLAASEYYKNSSAGEGILITAKGFPDLTTRSFLHTIYSVRPQLPIYALADYDPDGIAIMRTYKYGSQGLDHEENTTIPLLRWLGICSGDLLSLGDLEAEQDSQGSNSQQSQESTAFSFHGCQTGPLTQTSKSSQRDPPGGLLPLTSRDRKAAVNLLRGVCRHENLGMDEIKQQRELQLMLLLNIKAEIQAVDHLGDITDWLDQRLGI